jgi:hypothetical protein
MVTPIFRSGCGGVSPVQSLQIRVKNPSNLVIAADPGVVWSTEEALFRIRSGAVVIGFREIV